MRLSPAALLLVVFVVMILGIQMKLAADCHAKGGQWLGRSVICIRKGSILR